MTARAVSGGAVFKERKVSPVFSPEKLRMGRGVSWEIKVRWGVVWEKGNLRWGFGEKDGVFEKSEDEKKESEREEDEVVDIVVGGFVDRVFESEEM